MSIILIIMTLLMSSPGVANADAVPEVYYPEDVVAQFNALTERADALGFGIGDSRDPDICRHYQGIARSHGPGRPYFFITKSENNPPGVPCPSVATDGAGSLLVVRMGSRNTNGERLRSNRIRRYTETSDTSPDPRDTTVAFILFNGERDWPDYGHPGGVQLIGDVLAVPLETPNDPDLPEDLVVFIDVSNPEEPEYLSEFEPSGSSEFSAGLVAITPHSDRYLMLLAGQSNKELKIYGSLPTSKGLRDPSLSWELLDTWTEEDDEADLGADWPTSQTHQSLNFVREGGPDGALYLIGARGLPFVGEDWFDIYRVYWEGDDFKLRWLSSRHAKSFPSSDAALIFHNNIANFAAASGTYVSPSGEIILYATEHDNDGPASGGRGSIKAGEWRHVDVVRPDSSTLDPTLEFGGPHVIEEGGTGLLSAVGGPPETRAWLQLWADPGYTDRYVVIDYSDRSKDNFDDFKNLDDAPLGFGFSDQASSLRYFAPEGCTIRVNDDDFGDKNFPGSQTRTLPGAGMPIAFPDLGNVAPDSGNGDIDDEFTSAQFFENCSVNDCQIDQDCKAYYAAQILIDWDLDGIGDFDASGNVVTYSAELVDGPSEVPVLARATHPVDGRFTLGVTWVTVTNAPPLIEEIEVLDGLGRDVTGGANSVLTGVPVIFSASFDDPFAFDTHFATIDWGDGSITEESNADEYADSIGIATKGYISHTRPYANPGVYSIEFTVIDDDGGAGMTSVDISVAGPDQALEEILGSISELIIGETDLERLAALLEARDQLSGDNDGHAGNGALDHLEAGRLNTVLLRIADAIAALIIAESTTGDLTHELQGTLVLVAQALALESLQGALATDLPRGQESVDSAIDRAETAIANGIALARSDQYIAAVEQFRTAVISTEPLY